MDALSSKSSMVAMKVASLPSKVILVVMVLPFSWVLTESPGGVMLLSGDNASAMAAAIFGSLYSSFIVACKFFAF